MYLPMSLWSIILIISSNSWISMWMGLEINLMATIPLLYSEKNIYASESTTKYFIVQAFASSIFLFSVISLPMFPSWNLYMKFILVMAVLMKLGMPPFHFWLPDLVSGLSWTENMIILILQKIAPMIILINSLEYSHFMSLIIVMGAMISSIQGINQTDLRKIMAYSSINHMSWMTLSMMKSVNLWTIYFCIYALISFTVMKLLDLQKTYWLSNLSKNSKYNMIILSLNIMSMGGLPPMLGFLPKWMAIQFMFKEMMITTMILILLSIIVLYFYMRLTITSFTLINKMNMKFQPNMVNMNYLFMGTLMINILALAPWLISFSI
uniref:NADH-ubiquinone oxidoreductase chain 2 n=1 Tax=Platypodinae sp. BMNH 1274715 TaxID=2558031 RepID=A0A126TG88_9CUCU|nr:NADH dehydrogenase subunit 2 [Platypodinae sp. BMNH 1274715]